MRESTGQQGNFFSPVIEREREHQGGLGWASASSPTNFGLSSGVYRLECTSLPEIERKGEGKNEGKGFVDDERKRFNLVF